MKIHCGDRGNRRGFIKWVYCVWHADGGSELRFIAEGGRVVNGIIENFDQCSRHWLSAMLPEHGVWIAVPVLIAAGHKPLILNLSSEFIDVISLTERITPGNPLLLHHGGNLALLMGDCNQRTTS